MSPKEGTTPDQPDALSKQMEKEITKQLAAHGMADKGITSIGDLVKEMKSGQNWIDKHKPDIERLPGLQKQIVDLTEKIDASEATSKALKELGDDADEATKTTFLKADKAEKQGIATAMNTWLILNKEKMGTGITIEDLRSTIATNPFIKQAGSIEAQLDTALKLTLADKGSLLTEGREKELLERGAKQALEANRATLEGSGSPVTRHGEMTPLVKEKQEIMDRYANWLQEHKGATKDEKDKEYTRVSRLVADIDDRLANGER